MHWQKENFGHLQTLIARQLFVRLLYLLIRLWMISMFTFFVSISKSSVIILCFLITRLHLINICLFQWLRFCMLHLTSTYIYYNHYYRYSVLVRLSVNVMALCWTGLSLAGTLLKEDRIFLCYTDDTSINLRFTDYHIWSVQ